MKTHSLENSIGKIFLLILIYFSSCAKLERTEKPKLVILIVIDQFRASYLQEYGAAFTGGFRRLLDQGWYYNKAIVDHAPTLSFPGHTTLATGAHPKTHEINANDWYETLPNGEVESGNNRAYNRWFWNSPFADEALFALAKEAVQALALGQRNPTDFLALAIKSVDRIGHDFGPNSQEQLDILFRLDRQLGAFLEFLDDTVGKDNYILAVSADHGSINIVEYENEQGRPGRRVYEQELQSVLDKIDRFVKAYDGPSNELPERIARELERTDFIARAMTPEELSGTGPADEVLHFYRNSYVPERNTTFPLWTNEVLYGKLPDTHPVNWGIIVEFTENTSLWTARANHGTSHLYDREVPIIFMGKDIKLGIVSEPARTVDIAPTLADLAGIPFPNTVDGKVLPIP